MKKVLLIEDDTSLRQNLAALLTRQNFEVHEAEDGEQGVQKILDISPDAVVLDLLLPKLDGFAVLQRLRSYPDKKVSATRVVVFSNLWSDKDILQARALKIDHYFVKAYCQLEEVAQKLSQISEEPQAKA